MEVTVYHNNQPNKIKMTLAEAKKHIKASNHCKADNSSCDKCVFCGDKRCSRVGATMLTMYDEAAQRIVEAHKKEKSEEAV